MKKILAMAAVAALAAGASAYAANPFSDVSTSDWAYQAISDLSDRGMIDGYPDGTFKGQQNITRYEVAQIVARLMAKEDQMNAEDRAVIDRLAGEYGPELQNLGVRIGNLEKKIGNIVWSGDARMRYQKPIGSNDKFNGRVRLNARATVNDTTYVHGRLSSGNVNLKDGGDSDVSMDRLYVHHQFGKVGATLGRYELDLGQQVGGWLYANTFDGIEATAPIGEKFSLALGYGRMKDAYKDYSSTYTTLAFPEGVDLPSDLSDFEKLSAAEKDALVKQIETLQVTATSRNSDFSKAETFYAQAKGNLGFAKLGVDYFKTSPYTYSGANVSDKKSVWGVNLLVPINEFRVFGDYYADAKKNSLADQKGKIWTVGLGYGAKNLQKAGSYNIDLAYFKTKSGLYEFGMTGLQVPTADYLLGQNGHFWLATGDVVVAKNTYVHGEYAFSSKNDDAKKSAGINSWTLSLNYKF